MDRAERKNDCRAAARRLHKDWPNVLRGRIERLASGENHGEKLLAQAPAISTEISASNAPSLTERRRGSFRVLALVTEAFGGHGGIAQYNCDFLNALGSIEEVDAFSILPRVAQDSAEQVMPKLRQSPPIYGRISYSRAALEAALKIRPHVVLNAHLYHGALSLLVARLTGARLVSQLHGTEIWDRISLPNRTALKQSDAVLAVSRDTRRRYLSHCKPQRDTTYIVPNTVRPEFTPGNRTAARARFGLESEYAVLTVGRLDPRRGGYKGHGRVISLLPGLLASGRPLVYLIAGEGEYRARLERLARERGVVEHVRFLGRVPPEELPDLYRAADLFALPSTGEGFGIVYLEAMASGTPAIGLNVGGAPDALADGELGCCVSEEEFPAALAAIIAAPPPDRERLAAEVQRRFGFPQFCARVSEVLESLS